MPKPKKTKAKSDSDEPSAFEMAAVGGEGIATETMMELDNTETSEDISIADQQEKLTQMREDKTYKEELKQAEQKKIEKEKEMK